MIIMTLDAYGLSDLKDGTYLKERTVLFRLFSLLITLNA